MNSEQQAGKQPVYVYCGACPHEWVIAWLPLPIDVFCKLAVSFCPMCGSSNVFLGRRK